MSGNKKRAYSLRMTPGPSGRGLKWGQSTRSVKLLQTTETGNCFYSKCLDNFMQCSLLREVDSADDDKKKKKKYFRKADTGFKREFTRPG